MSLASVISETSVSREKEERRRRDTERMRVARETMHACMRACVRMLSRRECHRSISRGGWNFWPSRGVSRRDREKEREEWRMERLKKRKRDRGNLSRVGGEKGEEREERDGATMDGWMGESGSLPHLRAHPPPIWIARWSTHE